MDTSRHHYKVFGHVHLPAGLREMRLIVLSRAPMVEAEIRGLLDRSGRSIAGELWIEEVEKGAFGEVASYETPEDYVVVLPLKLDSLKC